MNWLRRWFYVEKRYRDTVELSEWMTAQVFHRGFLDIGTCEEIGKVLATAWLQYLWLAAERGTIEIDYNLLPLEALRDKEQHYGFLAMLNSAAYSYLKATDVLSDFGMIVVSHCKEVRLPHSIVLKRVRGKYYVSRVEADWINN